MQQYACAQPAVFTSRVDHKTDTRHAGSGGAAKACDGALPGELILAMTRMVIAALASAIILSAILPTLPAAADPVEDFYRGKQIRIVIRAAPGGNYDLYSRLLARHIVRFIPGRPSVIPVNMPGGSGLTALNYVADVHPRDGTVLTMVTQTFPLEQALALNDKLKVDMRALNWIGNMSDATSFLLTSRASATRTIEDAKRRETIIGVPSLADASAWLTLVTNGDRKSVV